VGRNPLFNYVLGNDLQEVREYQRPYLEKGLRSLAEYTANPRYNEVLKNFDVSWDSAGRYIDEFNRVSEAWNSFIEGVSIR